MLTRFELFVIVRNQVKNRDQVRRALAVEAIMEDLARACGDEPDVWALLGLGAQVDVELCAQNPYRQGALAAELLAAEGAPAAIVAALRSCRHDAPPQLSTSAAALVLAEALAQEIYRALDGSCCDTLDTIEPLVVGRRIKRDAQERGDEHAQRTLACAERLGLPLATAAVHAVKAMRRVRGDLRL